ncbi:MAG: ABC transporter substrate-binding protein [Planctomycetes bacterium]|nr:ABC transporter substrate-binding protein [Planctomycetota bacterium]
MILLGIDDTDILASRGTNQLARGIVRQLADRWRCLRIVRHQLLDDPRVPCTTKNGSASLAFEPIHAAELPELIAAFRQLMQDDFIAGSDPGLCVTERIPEEVVAFGERCRTEFVMQSEARELAARHGIHLQGLGGTEDGVIGALAAVGLAATGNDGRVVQIGDWSDDIRGVQPLSVLQDRQVEIREWETNRAVTPERIDVGKKLRPNRRDGRNVLFVQPPPDPSSSNAIYTAVKLP